MKYFNQAGNYEPFLRKCIKEKLWVKENRIWWGPYDWAWRYAVVNMGNKYVPVLGNPLQMIAEARAKELTDAQIATLDRFEMRVNAYYAEGKDEKLSRTMDTKLWVL